jgi:hypothetical protein
VIVSFRTLCAALAVLLAACGGGGSGESPSDGGPNAPPLPLPVTADISLLFMGNSHTSANGLTEMVADMVRAANPGRTVAAVETPGYLFLEDRLHDAASIALLRRQTWSFVIFQAQEYSTSGQFSYSTRRCPGDAI